MPNPVSILHTEIHPGYPVIEVRHPAASARIALHGAQIMEWTPAGQEPVLYLSPLAVYREGKAIRGGVPLCWPWFGPSEDSTLPAHGFARSRFWELLEASEDAAGVRLVFTLRDSEQTLRLWPHAFRLTMEMHIGASLQLALRMENTGDGPFTVTGALHTYLAVADVRKVRLTGLDGAEYLDTTGIPAVRRQEGDVTFDREVDRDYAGTSPVAVNDGGHGRVVTVRGSGSGCTVVWNPWVEKAKTLTDLPPGDYLRFVCVETANAWKDCITLAPGATHTLSTVLSVH